jgi:hypothetical protein
VKRRAAQINDYCPAGIHSLRASVSRVFKLLGLSLFATDGHSLLKMNFIFKIGDAILTLHAAEAHR